MHIKKLKAGERGLGMAFTCGCDSCKKHMIVLRKKDYFCKWPKFEFYNAWPRLVGVNKYSFKYRRKLANRYSNYIFSIYYRYANWQRREKAYDQ